MKNKNKDKYSISTRKGDEGSTSLLDGSRVEKFSMRPETYGVIDEANAFLGVLRAYTDLERTKEMVITIQNHFYYMNSELACPPDKLSLLKRTLNKSDVTYLDRRVNELEEDLQLPRSFVLYGVTVTSAYADIARAVIRRAERNVVKLDAQEPLKNVYIKKYLNRLSDLLFLLARYEEQAANITPLHPE